MAKKSKSPAPVAMTPEQIAAKERSSRIAEATEELAKFPLRKLVAEQINIHIEMWKKECNTFAERYAKSPADAFEWAGNDAINAAAMLRLFEGLRYDLNLIPPVEPTLEDERPEGGATWMNEGIKSRNAKLIAEYEHTKHRWDTAPRIDAAKAKEQLTAVLIRKSAERPMNSSSVMANILAGYERKVLAELLSDWDGIDRIFRKAARNEAEGLENISAIQ